MQPRETARNRSRPVLPREVIQVALARARAEEAGDDDAGGGDTPGAATAPAKPGGQDRRPA